MGGGGEGGQAGRAGRAFDPLGLILPHLDFWEFWNANFFDTLILLPP